MKTQGSSITKKTHSHATSSYISAISPENNLSTYLRRIREFPLLSVELEQRLAERWVEQGEIDAMHQIVNSHLRLVARVAMGYRGYGLPIGELISEGNIGLMQAVKRFDPERGFRFSTYAIWWIRAAIQEFILHSWSLVKIGTTTAQKRLFFNLKKLKSKLRIIEEGDLAPDDLQTIALKLKVSVADTVSMNRRLLASDQSLNVTIAEDSDKETQWQDWLVDERDNQEVIYGSLQEREDRRWLLKEAMQKLSDRERNILTERRLKDIPSTLQHLSQYYGISRERVRQIESKAFGKIQRSIKNSTIEASIFR